MEIINGRLLVVVAGLERYNKIYIFLHTLKLMIHLQYTRYRKWTRVALLTEVTEPASAEEARNHALQQQEAQMSMMSNDIEQRHSRSGSEVSPIISRRSLEEQDNKPSDGHSGSLRRRMKEAILKTASNI